MVTFYLYCKYINKNSLKEDKNGHWLESTLASQ
jgi:hypothetical protein